MRKYAAFLLALLLLLISAVSGVILWRYDGVMRENGVLREQLALALMDIERTRADKPKDDVCEAPPGPEWERLRSESRPDPQSWLRQSIISREDLIPWKGIHGGTMKIYDPSMVWFLGPRWCIAWVEDGHIGGYMLLRFYPEEEEPRWVILDSEIAD